MPLNLLQLQSIIKALKVFIDFIIVWVLIYYILKVVRNNSRTVQIFKGVVLVLLVRFIAFYVGLTVLQALADFVIQYGFLVFIIIFQQEIRGLLERIGKSTVFSALHSLSGNEREKLVNELVMATVTLSTRRQGALITLEQGHSLMDYIKTGTPINATVTADLLTSMFVTTTPLHDGAVIIQGDMIACASAYFPPTALELPTRFGARHRAAIGLSEITDSVTIVVSEETGTISIAESGRLTEMDELSLRDYLNRLIQDAEKEVSQRIDTRVSRKMNLSSLNIDPIRIEKVEEQDLPKIKYKKKRDSEATKSKKGLFKKSKTEADEVAVPELKDEAVEEAVETDLDSLKSATSRKSGGENDVD